MNFGYDMAILWRILYFKPSLITAENAVLTSFFSCTSIISFLTSWSNQSRIGADDAFVGSTILQFFRDV